MNHASRGFGKLREIHISHSRVDFVYFRNPGMAFVRRAFYPKLYAECYRAWTPPVSMPWPTMIVVRIRRMPNWERLAGWAG